MLIWLKIREIEVNRMAVQVPTFAEEEKLIAQGYRLIAGIDEVGRGPLAGPVVAAAVILPLEERPFWLSRVRDSKQLTPSQRESIFDRMMESGIAFGVGVVSHEVIDERGIAPATRLAMRHAIEQLSTRPDYLLIDYMRLPGVRIPQKGVVDGDSICVSIAAASIVAKVTRDHLMVELDSQFHLTIIQAARNQGLIEAYTHLSPHFKLIRFHHVVQRGRWSEKVDEEHHRIVKALEERDYRRLEKVITNHVLRIKREFCGNLAEPTNPLLVRMLKL